MALADRAPPPSASASPIAWARKNLFNSAGNTVLTLISLALLVWLVPPLFRWLITDAVFAIDPEACRAAKGACWGFIREKLRLILFSTYPYDEQWRPLAMVVILIGLIAVSIQPRFWTKWLLPLWIAGSLAMGILMWGGVFGLPYVDNSRWGGLPLTLILAFNGIVFSFPLAVLLALGRRSDLPAIKAVCIAFIELIRGVPLITLLFMAGLMIPLFLPSGVNVDQLLRAQIGIILFTAAYEAEVIRGGLQAIPKGQFEAADSLGLGYWRKTGFIVLPQALKLVIPPTVNTFISMLKDTSLVIIIGLYDLLGTARLAAKDPTWQAYYLEGLIFIGAIFFTISFSMSLYSRYLERVTNKGHKR